MRRRATSRPRRASWPPRCRPNPECGSGTSPQGAVRNRSPRDGRCPVRPAPRPLGRGSLASARSPELTPPRGSPLTLAWASTMHRKTGRDRIARPEATELRLEIEPRDSRHPSAGVAQLGAPLASLPPVSAASGPQAQTESALRRRSRDWHPAESWCTWFSRTTADCQSEKEASFAAIEWLTLPRRPAYTHRPHRQTMSAV